MILLEPCLGAWPHLLEPIARNAVGIQVNKVICDIDVGGGGGFLVTLFVDPSSVGDARPCTFEL